ncbi:small RNA-binding protein 11, chloroplastic-like [Papaver somniferum]|uniref:small RNA-binding protein 11, chloroplastic-like n=1 Tax=Papaver somniferum TaxID=3469 RepID=UPI000E6FA4BD|nr:small RNA-binding protein 11, chloroplastic-like [Papaver somniferum]
MLRNKILKIKVARTALSALMAPFRGVSRIIRQHAPSNPCFQRLLSCQLTCSRGIASKLFIKGLSFHTTEEALSEAFSKYGQVVEAKIVMDRVSDRSKGFGFVTFASSEEAKNATSGMNGKVLDGRAIFVDNANSVRTVQSIH